MSSQLLRTCATAQTRTQSPVGDIKGKTCPTYAKNHKKQNFSSNSNDTLDLTSAKTRSNKVENNPRVQPAPVPNTPTSTVRRQVLASVSALAFTEVLLKSSPAAAVYVEPEYDENFNYLENEPSENVIATEANLALSGAAPFLETIAGRGAVASIATCTAEALTLPLDTIKVRSQLSGAKQPGDDTAKSTGVIGITKDICKADGLQGLWKGFVPGMQHNFLAGGTRLGTYDAFKGLVETLVGTTASPLLVSAASGMLAGVLAIAVSNPTDVVKVRMQGKGDAASGEEKEGPLSAYIAIAKEEGFFALWSGFGPNAMRAAAITGMEFMWYDALRVNIMFNHPELSLPVASLIAGTIAGALSGLIINPVDLVKIQAMSTVPEANEDGTPGKKQSMLGVASQVVTSEGPTGLMRGVVPSVMRVGAFDGMVFFLNELIRQAVRNNF